MTSQAIVEKLQVLIGLRLNAIGRAANMLWLDFGERRESTSSRGQQRVTGDWSLHVQCAWRLCAAGRMLTARSDFYCSPGGEVLEDWDTIGATAFDAAARSLGELLACEPCFVVSAETDDVDGIRLEFSGGRRLDVFPDGSVTGEHWRLFRPGMEERHFVVKSESGRPIIE
jgi:hypothetical protein